MSGGPAPSATGISIRDHGHSVYSTPGFCFANMIINPVKLDTFEIGSAQSAAGFVTVPAFFPLIILETLGRVSMSR